MLHGYCNRRITVKRSAPGQHLVHHDAQSVDIGSGTDDFAQGLLRCVVLNRSQGHTSSGEAFSTYIFIDTGDAEVGQLNRPVTTYQHILWFDIAMHDTATMRSTQTKRDVVGNNYCAIFIEHTIRTTGMEIATQVNALYQLHDYIINAIGLTVVVDPHNIRMPQGRRRFRFELEAHHKLSVGVINFVKYFNGYDATLTHIPSTINGSHATMSYGLLYLVSISQKHDRFPSFQTERTPLLARCEKIL